VCYCVIISLHGTSLTAEKKREGGGISGLWMVDTREGSEVAVANSFLRLSHPKNWPIAPKIDS